MAASTRSIVSDNAEELSVSSLSEHEPFPALAHVNQQVVYSIADILRYRLSAGSWVQGDDHSDCSACGQSFNWSRKKRHCKYCGGVFCRECTSNERRYDMLGFLKTKVNVCVQCMDTVTPPVPAVDIVQRLNAHRTLTSEYETLKHQHATVTEKYNQLKKAARGEFSTLNDELEAEKKKSTELKLKLEVLSMSKQQDEAKLRARQMQLLKTVSQLEAEKRESRMSTEDDMRDLEEEWDEKMQRLQSESDELQRRARLNEERLQDELADANTVIEGLKQQLHDAQSLKSAEAVSAKTPNSGTGWKRKLMESKEEVQRWKKQSEVHAASVQRLNACLRDEEQKHLQASSEYEKELNAVHRDISELRDALTRERAGVNRANNTIMQQETEHENDIQEWRRKCDEHQQYINELELQLSEQHNSAATATAAAKPLSPSVNHREMDELRTQYEQQQHYIKELEVQLSENATATNTASSHHPSPIQCDWESEKLRLETEITELTQSLERTQHESLEASTEVLNIDFMRRKRESELMEQIHELEARVNDENVNELHARIERLELQNDLLQKDDDDDDSEDERMNDELRAKIVNLQVQLDKLTLENDLLHDEHDELTTTGDEDMVNMRAKLHELQEENRLLLVAAKANDNDPTTVNDRKQLLSKIEGLEAANTDLDFRVAELDEYEDRYKSLRKDHDTLTARFRGLLESTSDEIVSLEQQRDALQSQIDTQSSSLRHHDQLQQQQQQWMDHKRADDDDDDDDDVDDADDDEKWLDAYSIDYRDTRLEHMQLDAVLGMLVDMLITPQTHIRKCVRKRRRSYVDSVMQRIAKVLRAISHQIRSLWAAQIVEHRQSLHQNSARASPNCAKRAKELELVMSAVCKDAETAAVRHTTQTRTIRVHADVDGLIGDLNTLEDERSQLVGELERCSHDMNYVKQLLDDHRTLLKKVTHERDELRQQAQQTPTRQQLLERVSQLEESVEKAYAHMNVVDAELRVRDDDNETLKKLRAAEKRICDAEIEAGEALAEAADAKRRLADMESREDASLQAPEALHEQIEELEHTNKSLREQLGRRERLIEDGLMDLDELQLNDRAATDLRTRLNGVIESNMDLEKEFQKLEQRYIRAQKSQRSLKRQLAAAAASDRRNSSSPSSSSPRKD